MQRNCTGAIIDSAKRFGRASLQLTLAAVLVSNSISWATTLDVIHSPMLEPADDSAMTAALKPQSRPWQHHSPIELTLFDRALSVALPKGWYKAFDDVSGDMHSYEFVPTGQDLSNWQELMCVQGFNHISQSIDAQRFLDAFAARQQAACQGQWSYQPLGTLSHQSLAPVHAIMACGSVTKGHGGRPSTQTHAEAGYFQVYKVQDTIYMLHRSSRGPSYYELTERYAPYQQTANSMTEISHSQ